MKWFDPDRGMGLISQEDAGPDVQAEASAIHGEDPRLCQGEEVFCNVTLDSAGLRADNIRPFGGSPALPRSTPAHGSISVRLKRAAALLSAQRRRLPTVSRSRQSPLGQLRSATRGRNSCRWHCCCSQSSSSALVRAWRVVSCRAKRSS
ncbi:cold-shock protein [Streptomyces sp. NPDC048258]|uniref:cold-shock protein n=1 Tax=Streptomyces sp. NPDC048258 TaxID=3365527 RepID=UPI00371D5633